MDGKPDLVISGYYGAVTVLLGNGDGTFYQGAVLPAASYAGRFVVADFNHDGKPDIAVLTYSGYNEYGYYTGSQASVFLATEMALSSLRWPTRLALPAREPNSSRELPPAT